ncbi:tetratricopeptide repeat protein [Actinosynnema sp. NPDC020468]|uniref:tetratricopeptide repeat protein n=1 Tax=Actinosynnema sp. NPDC020468 TaxID=3154488 RepID=UPI00340A2B9A
MERFDPAVPGGTTNSVPGSVAGPVVQAGAIGQVVVTSSGSGTPPPWQVPPAPVVFVDREREVAELNSAGASRVLVLSGGPGTGKSALARRWAAGVREAYPDGQLYADLRSHRQGGVVELGAVVEGFLRSLGVAPDWVPADFAHRVGLLRTLTRDKRLLFLVEHVATSAQVLAWLPDAPGSAVAVTSRQDLAELHEHGALHLRVDPLPVAEGVDLLARYCGRERVEAEAEAAAELVRLCDGLPIALTVVGARLRRRGRSLAHVVAELSGAVDRLDLFVGEHGPVVRTVFDGAYADLPSSAARLYLLLGAHPGPAPAAEAVAALAGVTASRAEQQVDVLASAHLVEVADDGRVRTGGLVAEHAAARGRHDLPPEDRRAALTRVIRHYVRSAAAADLAAMGDRFRLADRDDRVAAAAARFTSPGEAMDWFDAERHNLAGAVLAAADLGLFADVCRLAESLWALYLNRKHHVEWISTHRRAVDAAAALDDPRWEARMRSQLARALIETRRFEQADEQLRTALTAAVRSGDRRLEASVLEFTGRLHLDRGAYDRAAEFYRRSLEINTALGRTRGAALQHHFLGQTLHRMGDHEGAREHLERALADLPGSDPRNRARFLTSLADVLTALGEHDRSTELLTEALRALRHAGADHFVAQALEQLADRTPDEAQARRWRDEAADLYRKGGVEPPTASNPSASTRPPSSTSTSRPPEGSA